MSFGFRKKPVQALIFCAAFCVFVMSGAMFAAPNTPNSSAQNLLARNIESAETETPIEAESPEPMIDFYGQVIGIDGEPERVEVRIRVMLPSDVEDPKTEDQEQSDEEDRKLYHKEGSLSIIETDSTGAFLLPVPEDSMLRVLVIQPGHKPFVVMGHEPSQPLQIQLEPGYELRGTVLARGGGQPVAGATVRFMINGMETFDLDPYIQTMTQPNGSFVLKDLVENAYPVHVFAKGKALNISRKTPWIAPSDGELAPAGETYFLDPGAEVSGKALDTSGAPVEGVTLVARLAEFGSGQQVLRRYQGGYQAISDEEGNFIFEGLPAEIKWAITISHESFAKQSMDVSVQAGQDRTKEIVRLTKGAEIQWSYELPEGSELGDVTFRVSPAEGNFMRFGSSMANVKPEAIGDGKYRVTKIPVGTHKLEWRGDHWLHVAWEEPVTLEEGQVFDAGVIKLDEGRVLRGTVQDEEGEPIEKASISIRPQGDWFNSKTVQTEPDGSFVARGLSRKALSADVSKKGYTRKQIEEIPTETEIVEWSLQARAWVEGEVSLEDKGIPEKIEINWYPESEAKGMQAMFSQMRPEDTQNAEPDEEGLFEAQGFSPGVGMLEIKAEGYKPYKIEDLELIAGEGEALDPIVLEKGLVLVGKITTPTGEPVAGAVASVSKPQMFDMGAFMNSAGVESDADGKFTVNGLEAGTVKVSVSHEDYAPYKKNISLKEQDEDQPTEIEVKLSRGGTLQGQVRDASGVGIPGQTIMSMIGMGGDQRMVETDADGNYKIERLSPGTYMVVKTGDNMMEGMAGMNMKSASIKNDETTILNFDDTAKINLTGTVRSGGEVIPDAQLVFMQGIASNASPNIKTSKSDAAGNYEVGLDKPGNYQVQVMGSNRFSANNEQFGFVTINVPDIPDASVDILLATKGLSGIIRDAEGNPVAAANVTAVREGSGMMDLEGQGGGISDANGAYQISVQKSGLYTVSVQHPEFPVASQKVQVDQAVRDGVDFELKRGNVLEGVVLDPSGSPVAGAIVQATPSGAQGNLYAGSSITNRSGRFELQVEGDEAVDVIATMSGFAPTKLQGVVPSAVEGSLTLQLNSGSQLLVKVVDASGNPVVGASVRLLPKDSDLAQASMDWWLPKTSDAQGIVSYDSLANGLYEVTLIGDDVPAPTALQVQEGEQTVVLQDPR